MQILYIALSPISWGFELICQWSTRKMRVVYCRNLLFFTACHTKPVLDLLRVSSNHSLLNLMDLASVTNK